MVLVCDWISDSTRIFYLYVIKTTILPVITVPIKIAPFYIPLFIILKILLLDSGFAIGYQTVLAYFTSMCIYQIGSLITRGTFGIGTVIAFLLVIGFIYLLFRPYKESKSLNINMKRMAGAK